MEVLHGPLEKSKPRQELHLLPHSMEKPSLVTAAMVSTPVEGFWSQHPKTSREGLGFALHATGLRMWRNL